MISIDGLPRETKKDMVSSASVTFRILSPPSPPAPLLNKKDEGFVSPVNIFSKEKAKEIRDEIELIEKKLPNELEKTGRYNAHLISPMLDEITHNEKILNAV